MSEYQKSNLSDRGLCEHGNFAASCSVCLEKYDQGETASEADQESSEENKELKKNSPDYPPVDLNIFKEGSELVQYIENQHNKVEQILSGEINQESLDEIIKTIDECFTLIYEYRKNFAEAEEPLDRHPVVLDDIKSTFDVFGGRGFDIERQFGNAKADIEIIKENSLLTSRAKQELDELIAQNDQLLEIREELKLEMIQERERLCGETEEVIDHFDGVFGFGLLPKTRAKNQKIFTQTQQIIGFLDGLKKFDEKSEGLRDYVFQGWELKRRMPGPSALDFQLARDKEKKVAVLLKNIESFVNNENALKNNDNNRQQKSDQCESNLINLRRRISNLFNGLKLDNTDKNLEQYKAEAISATELIREFEVFVSREFFSPLEITEEHEEVERNKPFPKETPEIIREVHERSTKNIREIIRQFVAYHEKRGKPRAEIVQDYFQAHNQTVSSAFIGYNESLTDLEEVLKDDKIVSVWHLPENEQWKHQKSIMGSYFLQRETVEKELGFKEGEKAIYLAIGTENDRDMGPASNYGPFYFTFSLGDFADKAVCTVGDSMNPYGVPFSLRNGLVGDQIDLRSRQLSMKHGIIAKVILDLENKYEPKETDNSSNSNWMSAVNYIEVQIPGPIDLDKAVELNISKNKALPKEIQKLISKYSTLFDFSKLMTSKYPNLSVNEVGNIQSEIINDQALKEIYDQWF